MAANKILNFFGVGFGNPESVKTPVLPPVTALIETEERAVVESCLALQVKNGIDTITSRYELLKCFLRESGIGVYPRDKVTAYMNSQFRHWRWFKLKADDHVTHEDGYPQRRVYLEPIPLAVLMRIDEIFAKFPDAIFEIAAEEDSLSLHSDPFLSVRLADHQERIVIERWNEPGFRS